MRNEANGYIYYNFTPKTEKEEVIETAWISVYHWLYGIVTALFVIFLSLIFFVRVIDVNGTSMIPTLSDSDRLLIYTFMYTPEQYDIVVISDDNSLDECLVKRVIAISGQTVDVNYSDGTVTVDGKVLSEEYLYEDMTSGSNREVKYPYTVPDGCVFVMGDNRNDSRDSRDLRIGCIDTKKIVGKAVIRLAPVGKWTIYEK